MHTPTKIFTNLFDDRKITNLRLANFADDCLTRFTTLNTANEFDDVIAAISAAVSKLRNDLGSVDSSINTRKERTHKVNLYMSNYRATMSSIEGALAFSHGKKSEIYLELYSNGIYEYTRATKTHMPTLMHRMNSFAAKYSTQLAPEVYNLLNTLKSGWETIRKEQQKQTAKVSDSRANRSAGRQELEMVLMKAVYTVALKYVGDARQCKKFFDFQLLHGKVQHQMETAG